MMTVYFLYIINIEYIPELNAEIGFGSEKVAAETRGVLWQLG